MPYRTAAGHRPVGLVILAAAVGLTLIGLSIAITYSILQQTARPSIALAAWPWNSRAMAEQASVLTQAAANNDAAPVQVLARRALALQAVNPVAARSLAITLSLQNNNAAALRALHYAEAMSRRDIATELALIEISVQKGDITGALIHYDRALRTSVAIQDTLFPILIAAASDPRIAPVIARYLATRPLWWRAFVTRLIAQNPSPYGIYTIVSAASLDAADPDQRALLESAMRQLAMSRRADLARLLLPMTLRSATDMVTNGDFEHDPRLQPFEWTLADDTDLGAVVSTTDNHDGRALLLHASNGRSGELARQLVTLAPGRRYALSLGYGLMPREGGISVTLTCTDGRTIAVIELPGDKGGQRRTAVAVPPACNGQWLIIRSEARFDTSMGPEAWIDDVRLAPLD